MRCVRINPRGSVAYHVFQRVGDMMFYGEASVSIGVLETWIDDALTDVVADAVYENMDLRVIGVQRATRTAAR